MRGIIILMMSFIRKNWAIESIWEWLCCANTTNLTGTWTREYWEYRERASLLTIPLIIYNPRPHRTRRVWPQQDRHCGPRHWLTDTFTRFIPWRLVTRVRLLLVTADLLAQRRVWEASEAPLAGDGHGDHTAFGKENPPHLLHYRPSGVTNPINWFWPWAVRLWQKIEFPQSSNSPLGEMVKPATTRKKPKAHLVSPPDQQHKEPTGSRGITFIFHHQGRVGGGTN